MASVVASVSGGNPKRVQASTVQGVKEALGLTGNYTAAINGDTANPTDTVSDEDYVTFATAVKGGASVVASVSGGNPKRVQAYDVQEVKEELGLTGNYTAAINGDTASLEDVLSDEDYVTFATAVKGGR
jgi:sulfur carrier protein ThiS